MARAKSNLQVDAEDKRLHADKDICHKEIAILITRTVNNDSKISRLNNEYLDIRMQREKFQKTYLKTVIDAESRQLYIEALRHWSNRWNRLMAETPITKDSSTANNERR